MFQPFTPVLPNRVMGIGFLCVLSIAFAAKPAAAQHDFDFTVTVDKSGRADFTSIQGAIDSISDNPSERWTILIYSDEYDEAVTLDDTQTNIDLVGIDRDGVVIAPSGTDENGITITSDTVATRNNSIRNLTIRTTDGHGVQITVLDGQSVTPTDVTIDGCTIEADGTDMDGVEGLDADSVLIRDSLVRSDNDDAIVVGHDWRLEQVTGRATNDADILGAYALDIVGRDNLVVLDSDFESDGVCAHFTQNSANTLFERSRFASTTGVGGIARGVLGFAQADGLVVRYCTIESDESVDSDLESVCVFSDGSGATGVVLEYCSLTAIGGEDTLAAIGVKLDAGGDILLRECNITATNEASTSAPSNTAEAWGVASNFGSSAIVLKGGSIVTSSTKEKEDYVFDVGSENEVTSPGIVEVSGTRMSKWLGPVISSERRRSTVQRVLDVSPADDDAVLEATALDTVEQEVDTDITNPDVYRAVTVTGSLAGMTQDVYIIGTNFAGDAITDKITLGGTSTVTGKKPFATVSKIILPAKNTQLIGTQTVSVGTAKRLGLQFPIGAEGDVIQVGRMESAETSYSVESLSGFSVDDVHSTVAPDSITDGDSFELVVLSSQ